MKQRLVHFLMTRIAEDRLRAADVVRAVGVTTEVAETWAWYRKHMADCEFRMRVIEDCRRRNDYVLCMQMAQLWSDHRDFLPEWATAAQVSYDELRRVAARRNAVGPTRARS